MVWISLFLYLEKGILFDLRQAIIEKVVSNKVNLALRKIVTTKEGTASFANIDGYEIAGKTGTAIKYNSKEKLNTFVSLFPTKMDFLKALS